ncbi:MAG: hypothetical protein ACK5M1_01815 [Xanthomarina gelatinilytica]|uniref:hypothetical protein n=1 Tax=Xanthomarina gelatinilytica TaxID=1137281 RepID=UPI003A84A181
MRNISLTLFVMLLIQSCIGVRKDDSIDLGNNYRFIQDTPQTIIYHSGDKYEGTGEEIIPPIVLSYQFNDRYIIAKSQEVDEMTGSKEGKPIRYWIIDKQIKAPLIKPRDSTDFYKTLEIKDIGLRFEE